MQQQCRNIFFKKSGLLCDFLIRKGNLCEKKNPRAGGVLGTIIGLLSNNDSLDFFPREGVATTTPTVFYVYFDLAQVGKISSFYLSAVVVKSFLISQRRQQHKVKSAFWPHTLSSLLLLFRRTRSYTPLKHIILLSFYLDKNSHISSSCFPLEMYSLLP